MKYSLSTPIKTIGKAPKKNQWKHVFLAVFILVLASLTVFLQWKNIKAKAEIEALQDPNRYAQEQLQQNQIIIDSLKEHLLLPDDEDPALYTITDIAHAQAAYGDFFKDAQNGDKLILYENQAVIYRLDEELIIKIGPIAFVSEENETENP